MLYTKMHKVLYGMLRNVLLFYRKLVTDLEEDGFKINPMIHVLLTKLSMASNKLCAGMWTT